MNNDQQFIYSEHKSIKVRTVEELQEVSSATSELEKLAKRSAKGIVPWFSQEALNPQWDGSQRSPKEGESKDLTTSWDGVKRVTGLKMTQ